MNIIEVLSLIAGLMTMAAPGAQAIKTIRSRNVAGLSLGSYVLLLCLGCFAVLIGVQYRVFFMTTLNAVGMSFNVIIMYLISRRVLAIFVGVLLAATAVTALTAPWILEGLITTRWSEPFAFAYGLVAAGTFLPQVLLTRRTRSVSALSLPNLLLFNVGMIIWIVVSVMLHNWSLIFWNGLLLLMLAELLRLKIVVERYRSQPTAEPITPTPVIGGAARKRSSRTMRAIANHRFL